MGYEFAAKLNKKPSGETYSIEEAFPTSNGVYEGPLSHDNVPVSSIRVYTGSRLSGEQVTNFAVSIPSDSPWRRSIRIYSEANPVYVVYETPGDTVEAEDINLLQDRLNETREELEQYVGFGVIDGGTF
ncbi:phosphoglucomutase [Cohnella fermenti]|uniref:Phosphoglucomutase n=1 Tax=Cohnella fermenti TaxID=2565925 RepID=A0A4S4BSK2_9BACL|nr:phosphoglucomutase [Cohnella fermenti]THF78019.1 phosphoglucomutase [Cohnella fermenti]